jgi:hypothetical protein
MPPKRGTPTTRSFPKRPSGASRAERTAAAARTARAARLRESEPEPEPEPEPAVYSQARPDPWAALAKVLRTSSPGGDETDDDEDDTDLVDTSRQRGRKLLKIERVDCEGRPPIGANDDRITRYHCLWEMNGVVLKYRQRTWETLDGLWDLGGDVQNIIRGYEREHPGTTDLVLAPLSDEEDSLQEQEQQTESQDNLQEQEQQTESQDNLQEQKQQTESRPQPEKELFTPDVLAGEWFAVGVATTGQVVEEMLLLRATSSGNLEGTVSSDVVPPCRLPSDGKKGIKRPEWVSWQALDPSESGKESVLARIKVDVMTRSISFDHVFPDGAITGWEATYDAERDMLIDGCWSGECKGAFTATRTFGGNQTDHSAASSGEQTADAAQKSSPTAGGRGRWYRVRNRCAVTAECLVSNPQTVEIIHECVHDPLR